MSGYSTKVKEIARREEELNLSEDLVLGIPIWRVLRFRVRTLYFKKTTDFNNKSNTKSVRSIVLLKQYCLSFSKIALLILKNKRYKNLIFAFPRLTELDGLYIDKFTDPVIKHSKIKEDVLIFQKNLTGKDHSPRAHKEHLIESDFIDLTAKALSYILFPIFVLLYYKKIKNIYDRAQSFFLLPKSFVLSGVIEIGEFYISSYLNKIIIRKLKAKNIFIVGRGAFKSVILAGHKAKTKVFEIQHGVTMADTILYTGEYHPLADPDYFLAFGEKWKGPQFYMPQNKLINIGWAYKKETLQISKKLKTNYKDILVISSPNCTFKLFNLVHELSIKHPNRTFYLRLHPQEAYQQKQLDIIKTTPNIKMEPNQIDSAIIVNLYEHIMGENSSVLFEALCAGKKVARLDMGGLDIKDEGEISQKGFYYLRNVQDFDHYLSDQKSIDNGNLGIYDDFKDEVINQLID